MSQTAVVIEPPLSIPRYSATPDALDILELVRTGALGRYPTTAEAGTVELTLPDVAPPELSVVELTDAEGLPIVRLSAVGTPGGTARTRGAPTWLARRSARPFEDLHRGPGDQAAVTGVLAFQGPAADREARAALSDAGPRPLLLALTSLDGEPSPAALETARQVRDLATTFPGARAVVVPVPTTLDPEEVDAVVGTYAAGRPVFRLGVQHPDADRSGVVVFFTGLSGSGKSTLARALRNRIVESGQRATLLDGDRVRQHLSAGLGFSPADRDTNIRRIGWVAAEIAYHGGIAICSPIAPYEHTRQAVRQMVESRGARFVLVHVATPLAECERRDRKGLYARARRGEIPDFTGVTAPYEEPTHPALRIDTTDADLDSIVTELHALLEPVPPDAG